MDNEHYRFGFTSSKEVLEEKRYSGCTVLVYPVVSIEPFSIVFVSCTLSNYHLAAFSCNLQSRFVDARVEKTRVRYPFKKIVNLASLETFMHQKALPLVGEMTPQNEQLYRNTGLPVVTVFTRIDHADKVDDQVFQDLLKRVRAVAVKFTKLKFCVADAKSYLKDMDQMFGFEQTFPEQSVSVGLREGSVYYAMPQGEFSEELMEQFVLDFLTGKLEGIEQVKNEFCKVCHLHFI